MDLSTINNREKEFSWEWFRRSEWINNPSVNINSEELCKSVARILLEAGADNCLEYLCGFGHMTRELLSKNLNVMGCDFSASAIKGAKLLATQAGINMPFFLGHAGVSLVQSLPHKFKSIFSTELLYEPNWHELRQTFVELYNLLAAGGFVVFLGASESSNFAADIILNYDKKDAETLDWSFRDGNTSCSKLVIKAESAPDYRDYKNLYISTTTSGTDMEVIQKRIPGYWNNRIIKDLAYEVGFCHFETRTFDFETGKINLNIAYTNGRLGSESQIYQEEEAYYDF